MVKRVLKNRLLLGILIPVMIIGSLFSIMLIQLLLPSITMLIKQRTDTTLRHASKIGITACEERFDDILELRMEDNIQMNIASQKEAVEQIKKMSRIFPGVQMLIIKKNGKIIGSSLKLSIDKFQLQKQSENQNSIITEKLENKHIKLYSQFFPFWRWHVISFMFEEDYNAPILMAKQVVYIGTFGVLLVVLITLLIFFIYRINRPLKNIISATQEVSGGNLIPMTVKGKDEISQVSHAFNSMVHSLIMDKKKLARAQKMEAIGTLTSGVAHDLNNILSGLVGYPDLILFDMTKDDPLRKQIETIKKSGQKAADIVQDMLTLARRGVSITGIVNINEIITEYLSSPEFAKLQSFHPEVVLKTHFEPELLNIKGSQIHLSKTIMNLVSNAAESMPDGGTITITTKNQYIDTPFGNYDTVKEGDYIVVTISDTGIGIPSGDLEKIFEPFFTKKAMGRSGTGLGMAVVWGTIKDHDGYIDMVSLIETGTTFSLYFPMTREIIKINNTSSSIKQCRGNGEKVLIVDDVEEQREIASEMLKQLNYSVCVVSSGETAVEYMKKKSADLLILDMIMDPGIDGLETYEKILEIYPNQKAIIASGYSETNRVQKAKKLGAGEYIKKPYTLEKLGLTVKCELKK